MIFAPEFSAGLPESVVKVELKDTDKCSRYSGICIKGVKIAPSPDWLISRLQTIGLSPINNIVDITNFVLHLTSLAFYYFNRHVCIMLDLQTLHLEIMLPTLYL